MRVPFLSTFVLTTFDQLPSLKPALTRSCLGGGRALFTTLMDILNMLGLTGSQTQQASQQLGVAPNQMTTALEAAVPLLLGKLTQNATTPEQAQALSAAVEQHDGSALDAFQSGQLPNLDEGQSIVRHVFGGQQDSAAYAVAQRAGISSQTAMSVLAMVAPLVMAYLGRNRTADSGMGNLGGLGGILGSVLGGGGLGSVLGSVLGGAMGGNAQAQQYQQPQYQQPQQQGGDLGSIIGGALGGGGLGSVLGSVLGGAMGGGQEPQQQYQQPYQQDSGDLSGGVGLEPVGQAQPQYQEPQYQDAQQPQQQQGGGIFGSVDEVLGGNHGALDDLIGMFGGGQR